VGILKYCAKKYTFYIIWIKKKIYLDFEIVGTKNTNKSITLNIKDLKTILKLSDSRLSDEVIQRLFRLFSTNVEHITFSQYITALSTVTRGTMRERMNLLFHYYDKNNDGYITKEELQEGLKPVISLLKELSGQDFDIQTILKEADKNLDKISVEGFVALIQGHPTLLEITHVFSTEEENIKHIKYMVAIDGGLASDRAFDHVLRVVKENDEVFLVYVHEPVNADLRPPLMHLEDYIKEHQHKGESMKKFSFKVRKKSIRMQKRSIYNITLYWRTRSKWINYISR